MGLCVCGNREETRVGSRALHGRPAYVLDSDHRHLFQLWRQPDSKALTVCVTITCCCSLLMAALTTDLALAANCAWLCQDDQAAARRLCVSFMTAARSLACLAWREAAFSFQVLKAAAMCPAWSLAIKPCRHIEIQSDGHVMKAQLPRQHRQTAMQPKLSNSSWKAASCRRQPVKISLQHLPNARCGLW